MSTLSFPTSPSVNQTYTFGTKTWVWTGVAWQLQVSGAINNIPIGNSVPSTGAFTNLSGASITGGNLSITGNTQSGNLTAGGVTLSANTIGTTSNLTLTSSNVIFAGNVLVQGNTTFINANAITTNSLYIDLANNAATGAAANNAGIRVGNANATIYANWSYNNTANVWQSSIGVSAIGNVTAPYFIGNGATLSNITGANVTGTVANAVFATSAGTAATVTTAAQPNITSVGLLSTVSAIGDISTAGNIYGGGIRSTTSATPPSNPSVGDFWYDTNTNAQYRWTFDGTDYFWLDDYGSTLGVNGAFSAVTNGTSNIVIANTNSNATVSINGVNNVAVFAGTGFYTTALNITQSTPPATSTSAGVAGQIAWDSGFLYVCVATNTWTRTALTTW
jgi:hypothetical protein